MPLINSFRRKYPESEAGAGEEITQDFEQLKPPPSHKHTSSESTALLGDDHENEEDSPHRPPNNQADVLHDRTNIGGRPWTGSSDKRPEIGKHISYDSIGDEDQNPWGQH